MTHHIRRKILPFTAIVGQEKMKKVLILNAINQRIGGVLIRGEKGTAKSTAVRAIAELLPEIYVVKGCPFNCDPNDPNEMCDICYTKNMNGEELDVIKRRMRVIDLPLGATEDRVVGMIDVERAIKDGIKALEPGILADANRGILYIDEVNLLDDHVADVLLDSAAMSVNVVEREGVSVSHPSNFILVGTMNPEEGELRPQLLDRFGLQVGVESIDDAQKRVQIVKSAEAFERDSEAFREQFDESQRELRDRILSAKSILKDVEINDDLLQAIANTCIDLDVRSHRAEIVITRTAKTIAALDGRKYVTIEDVKEAMDFALPHRMRRMPFESPQLDRDNLDKSMSDSQNKKDQDKDNSENNPQKNNQQQPKQDSGDAKSDETDTEASGIPKESVFDIGKPIDTRKIDKEKKDSIYRRRLSGRSVPSVGSNGKYIRSEIPKGKPRDIALDATIRAAAPYQNQRENDGMAIVIKSQDMREKTRVGKVSNACVFVVDASGSMGAMKRMESAKGAVLSLLMDSYQKRNRVALVAFRGDGADLLLPPSSGVEFASKLLKELPTGGKTPLSAGLYEGLNLLRNEKKKNADIISILFLITDGRANVPLEDRSSIKDELRSISEEIRSEGVHTVVIDTETSNPHTKISIGYNKEIAEVCGAEYYRIEDLSPGKLGEITRFELDRLIGS